MTSEQKVRLKYPNADIVHMRGLGLTVYVVRPSPDHIRAGLGEGFTASAAWVDAAKNIAAGKREFAI